MSKNIKSVITCDLDGKVETFSDGAVGLFGYSSDEVVGKKVVMLTNLEPRAIRGIESQGMILMADDGDGRLIFISPEDENTPSGLTIQ